MPPSLILDDTIRGIPPGTDGLPIDEVGRQGWHPADGVMSLPVLTIDEAGYAQNAAAMLRYAAQQGAVLAPHAKTPMAPSLAASLVAAGAWGTTVADIRQAAALQLKRLILLSHKAALASCRRVPFRVDRWGGA